MIDCGNQSVWFRTPSRGELVIHEEGAQREPTLCSAVRARRYLRHGCFDFVVYVLDTREEIKRTIDDMLVVRV